jgi:hypothetical protein
VEQDTGFQGMGNTLTVADGSCHCPALKPTASPCGTRPLRVEMLGGAEEPDITVGISAGQPD